MQRNPNESAVIERLIMILKLCEKGGLPGKNIRLSDMEAIGVYLMVLKSNRIDAEILHAATPDILSERFFPTPGAIAERCRPHRETIEGVRSARRFEGWIDCLDPRGGDMIAPPRDVFDGRYVPGCGNGVALGAALPQSADDSRLKAMIEGRPAGALSLPLPSDEHRIVVTPEREAELVEEARSLAESRRRQEAT